MRDTVDTCRNADSSEVQLAASRREYYENLALVDALDFAISQEEFGPWHLYRFVDSFDEIPSCSTEFVKCWIHIFNKTKIVSQGRLSVQDLNAKDWVVCHERSYDKYIRKWIISQTRNWPGRFKDFKKYSQSQNKLRRNTR